MYPDSRAINGAFRPSPSAIGHQKLLRLLAQMEHVDDHDGSIQSFNAETCELAGPPPPLSMNAAIDRVPKQSIYAAVELDAWTGTSVEPLTTT